MRSSSTDPELCLSSLLPDGVGRPFVLLSVTLMGLESPALELALFICGVSPLLLTLFSLSSEFGENFG